MEVGYGNSLKFLTWKKNQAFATKPPRWDATYITKGILYIPYVEIAEPFFAWYDKNTRRSRIDYYGGMVKTYQSAGEDQYGTSLKLAPVTNKNELNKVTCLQLNGTADNRIQIQSVLPNASDFQLVGTETFLRLVCDKFRLGETIEKKRMSILYGYAAKSHLTIPVLGYLYPCVTKCALLGSHYDHYYLDYDSYEHDDIPNVIFELDPGKQQSLRFIQSKSRAQLYALAISHLADKTDEELKAIRGFRSSGVYNTGKPFPYDVSKLTDQISDQYDWRLYGAVTPVKDQSVCCWSFGTIGHIEGAYFLKNGGNLVRLSQQALIDCSWQYGNNGCRENRN
uniref:Peptidase C1A papain C-terminal domain-containing protein n=1 Tax=Glossina morsitans morsitans TaxID=37546 RepID=A0A1B0GB46_GLOMM